MTTYIYIINNTEMEDTRAFGDVWKKAKEMATNEHTTIERTIVRGNGKIEHEFYAKGGCFVEYRDAEDFNRNVKIW